MDRLSSVSRLLHLNGETFKSIMQLLPIFSRLCLSLCFSPFHLQRNVLRYRATFSCAEESSLWATKLIAYENDKTSLFVS